MARPLTVGVDGSPQSLAAAHWAAREAERRGLPLRLVHAWINEPLLVPPDPDEEVARGLLDRTRATIAEAHPDVPLSAGLLPEVATTGLAEESGRAEMLVLGSRGHGPVLGFLLGSVGLPVIAHATCPVVLVRSGRDRDGRSGPDGEPPADGTRGPESGGDAGDAGDAGEIVVAIKDAGPAALPLLDFAFTTAAARGAAVRAVRAWGTPSLFGADVPDSLEANAGAAKDLEGAEADVLSGVLAPWRRRHPEVPVTEHLRFGNAAEVLLSAALPHAGLVVVGRRPHHRLLGTRIGPVVHAVLHHAWAPVAVVPYDIDHGSGNGTDRETA
ncbi:universal stress protein [Streptomyces marincola]|uniref:universal stress protein n=1 Tax=Streptomyces marincola TaxID=2878388 RepID=UPI001CF4E095|nr:universal stress protein [Streptomyces marincola]UCM87770.1 universal stress protein [Streptomyces marincola]